MTNSKQLRNEWDTIRAHPSVWPLRAGVQDPDVQGFMERALRVLEATQEQLENSDEALALWQQTNGVWQLLQRQIELEADVAKLRETLAFVSTKLRIVLSSHICVDHGVGPCGDRENANEALRRSDVALKESE